jgi:hypothetical protein
MVPMSRCAEKKYLGSISVASAMICLNFFELNDARITREKSVHSPAVEAERINWNAAGGLAQLAFGNSWIDAVAI